MQAAPTAGLPANRYKGEYCYIVCSMFIWPPYCRPPTWLKLQRDFQQTVTKVSTVILCVLCLHDPLTVGHLHVVKITQRLPANCYKCKYCYIVCVLCSYDPLTVGRLHVVKTSVRLPANCYKSKYCYIVCSMFIWPPYLARLCGKNYSKTSSKLLQK